MELCEPLSQLRRLGISRGSGCARRRDYLSRRRAPGRTARDHTPLGARRASVEHAAIRITTAPVYAPGQVYKLLDHHLSASTAQVREVTAGAGGRISFTLDGQGHQISFAGPGTGAGAPVLLPLTSADRLRLPAGKQVHLPVRIYNPRAEPVVHVGVALSSDYPTVKLLSQAVTIPRIEAGGVADLTPQLAVEFTAGSGYFAPTLLVLKLTYDGWHEKSENIDLLVTPDRLPAPAAYQILDGRTVTVPVFRQKGNQGGGGSIPRTVHEGQGNGNGKLEPGEEATIWVQLEQGLDPFDKGNWYRAKVYTDSPWITEPARFEEQKQLEWTGAKELTSVIRLAPDTPPGTEIPLLLDNESWSFTYTPDVRYGKEVLYQAFELHEHYLHQLKLIVGGDSGPRRDHPAR